MEDVDCWIEVDAELLDKKNTLNIADDRTLKDYVLMSYIKDNKALIKAAHCDVGSRSRIGFTSNDELRLFISEFANADMSNVYVENVAIKAKLDEYSEVIL